MGSAPLTTRKIENRSSLSYYLRGRSQNFRITRKMDYLASMVYMEFSSNESQRAGTLEYQLRPPSAPTLRILGERLQLVPGNPPRPLGLRAFRHPDFNLKSPIIAQMGRGLPQPYPSPWPRLAYLLAPCRLLEPHVGS